jgi:hypothetical protein
MLAHLSATFRRGYARGVAAIRSGLVTLSNLAESVSLAHLRRDWGYAAALLDAAGC